MYGGIILTTAIFAGVPSWVNAQQSGWVEGQKSATMCAWQGLRAAQINDTVYMDGGFLFWARELENGDTPVEQDGNPLGLIYTLNFSVPFNTSTNISSILGTKSKARGGEAANGYGPNYYDGAMLANNLEFFLYGGLLKKTDAYELPDADATLSYQAYDELDRDPFHPGFVDAELTGNLTRYVTYGGAVNAPSENKAWYFGGHRSQSWGPIYQPSANKAFNPVNASDTLITLDFNREEEEKWSNSTLPPGTPSRANPSVVWVPVGEQGILVVLGGVLYPAYSTETTLSLNEAQSLKDSPGYMINIDIYDIAGDKWYQQPTSDAPPTLAMGCAVAATAQDLSSFNIYYYGGYDGIHDNEDFNDDVWILSLPSFIWTKIPGESNHARAGHQCLMPYPDQMVSVGGFRALQGIGQQKCLDKSMIEVFNLTSAMWLDSYDPSQWNEYGVPEVVHSKIGGDYTGGATITAPDRWAATGLANVFAATYPASKITPNYPYSSQSSGGNETRGPIETPKKEGGTPSWVAPVLGVVLGLVFLTAVAVGILLYRKRRVLLKKNGRSDTPTDDYRHFVRRWLNTTHDKEQTETTEDPTSRYDIADSRNETPMASVGISSPSPYHEMMPEMSADQRFELPDTSQPRKPAELTGESLHYIEVLMNHSQPYSSNSPHSGAPPHSPLRPHSPFTGSVSQDQPSSLSSSQAGIPPPSMAATLNRERADSPALGNSAMTRRTPPPNRIDVVSDISRISESHMSHLRNLSGGTVSSTSAPSLPSTPPAIQTGFNGPVSPPLPSPPSALDDNGHPVDYMTVHQSRHPPGAARFPGTNSASRLSAFTEDTNGFGESAGRPTHNTQ